jgi:hypothetical protein
VNDQPPDDIGLLATAAMQARRHPWAIAGVWAWETALAVLVAWPARSLASAAYGANPAGDAALWAPGGHPLLDFLWHDYHGVRALFGGATVVLVAGAIAGIVPMASLLVAMAYATRDKRAVGFSWSLREGVRLFPAMALQLVLVGVGQGLALGAGALLASLVKAWTHGLGEARSLQVEILVALLFVAVAATLGVARDLSAAAVVRFKVRGMRGLTLGVRTFRLAPLTLWWSWAWRSLASLVPLAVGAWVADRLGGRGGMPLFVLLLIHQSVVLSRVALRASWLARALRAVDGALVRRG